MSTDNYRIDAIRSAMQGCISQHQAERILAAIVPPGWRIVPEELSPDQACAMLNCVNQTAAWFDDIYKAALDSAPPPTASSSSCH